MSITATTSKAMSLRDQLGHCTAESMQEMVALSEKAIQEKNLNAGLRYPLEYARALGASGPRYVQMRELDCLARGWAPSKFFVCIYDTLGSEKTKRNWSFLVKKEVLPSNALKAVKQGLALLDCGAACQIARYDALLKVLGQDKFNRLFSEPHGKRMNIGYQIDDDLQPMRYFVDFSDAAKKQLPGKFGARLVQEGQLVSFYGPQRYQKKHPHGMGNNFNVICLNSKEGEQRYVGHGLPSTGASEEEICLHMVKEYNEEPEGLIRCPEKLRFVVEAELKMKGNPALAKDQISEKNPQFSVQGFDRGSAQDFCVDLIEDLVKLPLEKISMDYVKTHVKANRSYQATKEQNVLSLQKMIGNMLQRAPEKKQS